jgi:uncharacterized membrane protein
MKKYYNGWWNSPVRLIGFSWDPKRESIEDAVKRFKERGGKVIAYGAVGGPEQVAYYRSKVLPVSETIGDTDPLKELTEAAKKYGLRTRVYVNFHWFDRNFYEKHKDWAQIKADGAPLSDLYGEGWSMCVNSPWRDFSFKILEEIARNYPVDAIFLDGPAIYGGCCYCKHCRELFFKEYGADIPREPNWEDINWKRFIEFRYESLARYMKDAYDLVKSINSDIAVYSNLSGVTWPKYGSAVDPERLAAYEDIIGVECYQFYTRPVEVPIWFPTWTTKYAYSISNGKPVCLFLAGGHLPWYLYPVPDAEVKLSIAQGVANGAMHTDVSEPGANIFRIVEENPQYFVGTKPIADVAILWSRHTGDFYTAKELLTGAQAREELAKLAGDFHIDWSDRIRSKGVAKSEAEGIYVEEVRGFFEALLRSHVLFDLIGEVNLTVENLSKYKALILPASACLSSSHISAIKSYVESGGNLIVSYVTSLYDEWGRMLRDFALSDVLPVEYLGFTLGPFRWDYMRLKEGHKVTRDVKKLLPAPQYLLGVEAKSKSETLGTMMAPLPHRYGRVEKETRYPTIVVGEYGKGKVIYFAGNFGGQYWAHRFPDYRKLIVNALDWAVNGAWTIEVEAPQTVEVSLFSKDDFLVLHIVNMTHEYQRPVEKVLPVNVNLKIKIPGIKVKSALSLTRSEKVNVKDENELTLRNIAEYECIVIKLS